ncbi:hypothetical protein WBG99_14710 [Streptomyces sp. TG1A-60]|uniref:hypothetical protein n=1 Tax=Streptomyces sp. TG1A-60 TaxID=3129111 RepID=UPI0030D57D01
MPRGRHRHSPPLHRLLPPTAIAGVSLVCALGPWVFSEQAVLRVTAAVAAATATVGAAVMRRWDVEAGKRVADLTRARASDEWRHEEKVAELETDLDESRELRTKLEHKLRAKRAELANLRNEHAALLRRYATAETERASALEGRRLLEVEATDPEEARALPAAEGSAAAQASPVPPQGVPAPGAPWASWEAASKAAKARAASGDDGAGDSAEDDGDGADAEGAVDEEGTGARNAAPAVFSPAGSSLFLRANSALDRIITQRGSAEGSGEAVAEAGESAAEADVESGAAVVGVESRADIETGDDAEAEAEVDAETRTGAVAAVESQAAEAEGDFANVPVGDSANVPVGDSANVPVGDSAAASAESADVTAEGQAPKGGSPKGPSPKGDPDGPTGGGTRQGRSAEAEDEPVPVLTAEEDDAAGKSVAADGHERAGAEPVPAVSAPTRSTRLGETEQPEEAAPEERVARSAVPALPALPPAGHFAVPTAVAVVPTAPQRRTAVEGGFDFFGTEKDADALQAVQNEDLADVVGQEALVLHKAESEARFKRPDEASRGVGQVIDLTAHDETEQIDVQGLRSAAS